MIVEKEEYSRFSDNIKAGTPTYKLRIPEDEPIYEIDLNTRTISVPQFLGVETDHEAEIIYFIMDRYYENIDLSHTVGLVVYKNAKKEEYAYVIPYYDIDTEPDKIIFGWNIQGAVTKYTGTVQFAFKFFIVDDVVIDDKLSKELLFELNTLVATSKVLQGWGSISSNTQPNEVFDLLKTQILIDNNTIQSISNLRASINELRALQEDMKIFWIDV